MPKEVILVVFQYLEDIATADVAFKAEGGTLEEVFVECALATFEAMIDTKKVEVRTEKEIVLESKEIEGLLMDWLSHLVFIKDAESLAFSEFYVRIKKNDVYRLVGKAGGEEIDRDRHELRSDVKGVTYHRFELVEKEEGWEATVVLDI
ncbi:MAG: archease [Candidatus Hydrothermarchaeaceae archaeon]